MLNTVKVNSILVRDLVSRDWCKPVHGNTGMDRNGTDRNGLGNGPEGTGMDLGMDRNGHENGLGNGPERTGMDLGIDVNSCSILH